MDELLQIEMLECLSRSGQRASSGTLKHACPCQGPPVLQELYHAKLIVDGICRRGLW